MNIIIIGAGKVGQTIARYLSDENDNVTIIDNKVQVLEKINDELDVMCVKGNCTDLRVLSEAGINEADILIAVTNSDELNMLCCLAAKKLGAKYTVARVRTPHYDEDVTVLADAIGIDLIINPEKAAANEISKMLRYPSICSIDDFSRGQVNLAGFTISENSVLVDMRVCDIDYIKGLILFCGVERDDDFIIPNGEFKFKKEDKIYVIGEHKNIEGFLKRLGKYKKRVKNVMIIGGSRIGYYLAKSINDVGINCKIVEKEISKCEELTELLPKSVIINGDGMDENLLLSESLTEMDSFIALTGRDEDNILASLFALNKNIDNIITKITRDNYYKIAKNIDINAIINPKIITANRIIKHVRRRKNQRKCSIENVYKICNEKAEAIELIVNDSTENFGIKLKNIKFNKENLVAVIVRNDKTIIPSGDDCLKINDRVVIVTKNPMILDINDIFDGGTVKDEL